MLRFCGGLPSLTLFMRSWERFVCDRYSVEMLYGLHRLQKIYLSFSLPKLLNGFQLNLALAFGSKRFLAGRNVDENYNY